MPMTNNEAPSAHVYAFKHVAKPSSKYEMNDMHKNGHLIPTGMSEMRLDCTQVHAAIRHEHIRLPHSAHSMRALVQIY